MVNLGSSESAERTGVRAEVRFPERTSGNSHSPCRRMFRLPRFQFGVTIRNIRCPAPVRLRWSIAALQFGIAIRNILVVAVDRGHGWAGARSRRDRADHRSGRKARAGLRRGLHGPRERRGKRGPGWDRHGAGRVQEDPMRARRFRAGRGGARGRESGVSPGPGGAGLGRSSWRRLRGRLRGVPGRRTRDRAPETAPGSGPPRQAGHRGSACGRSVRAGTVSRSCAPWMTGPASRISGRFLPGRPESRPSGVSRCRSGNPGRFGREAPRRCRRALAWRSREGRSAGRLDLRALRIR